MNYKISIVTGTLNRLPLLKGLLENTVKAHKDLELILVDGGSSDGTIDFIKNVDHPRVRLIEYGKRSSYPHFMNLGIRYASHELICQWNDDVILLNSWNEVFDEIDNHDAYLFSWQNKGQEDLGWNLLNNGSNGGEVVMNYGIYTKDVFRKYGLYNDKYRYYFADAEMALRAYCLGAKFKNLHNIKASVLPVEKTATHHKDDAGMYYRHVKEYHLGKIDKDIEYL